MKSFTLAAFGLLAASTVQAHMDLSWPTPFRSKHNPNVPETSIDYSMTNPLSPDGSDYPCKGYQVDLGTPMGAPVVEYTAGQTYNVTIEGTASHGGGSCQMSFSFDKGATFTVVQSYEGDCPLQPNWDFTVPSDIPTGEAIFAWSWHNKIGNREMYMNCVPVTVIGGSGSGSGSAPAPASSPASTPVAAAPSSSAAPAGAGAGAGAAASSPAAAAPAASSPPAAPSNDSSIVSGGAGCYMPSKAKANAAAPAPAAPASSSTAAAASSGDDYSTPPNITGLVTRDTAAVAYSTRPTIFLANIGAKGNGCTTLANTDLKYPSPGPANTLGVDASSLVGPSCPGSARRAVHFRA